MTIFSKLFKDIVAKIEALQGRVKSVENKIYELNKRIDGDKKRIDEAHKDQLRFTGQFELEKKAVTQEIELHNRNIKGEKAAIHTIISEAEIGQPWLSKVISDYYYYRDVDVAEYLEKKKNPATKLASEIRSEFAVENRTLRRRLKEAEYRAQYLEWLFPALEDILYDDEPVKELTEEENTDETLIYVSQKEYLNLSATECNQLALDRYRKGKHSKQHIGKMYERYVGHLYESSGYDVEYFGIKNGLEDLGRDLICKKDKHLTLIVQCKNWSSKKEIHENAICQLYGTTVKYKMENKIKEHNLFSENVKAVFVTTTKLSDTALEFAEALGVNCVNIPMSFDYPMIKCNVNHGQLIYHLPFDQQYDRTIIRNKGEMYVTTVQEAESYGFRRAKRWVQEM